MNSGNEHRTQGSFPRRIDVLDRVFALIEEFFDGREISPAHLFTIKLAVEELFTNLVKYNKDTDREIEIELEQGDDRVTISLTDFDVEPFDITNVAAPELDIPLEQKRPGGLGIHLVKQMVDQVSYEYVDRRSKTTLIKLLR